MFHKGIPVFSHQESLCAFCFNHFTSQQVCRLASVSFVGAANAGPWLCLKCLRTVPNVQATKSTDGETVMTI